MLEWRRCDYGFQSVQAGADAYVSVAVDDAKSCIQIYTYIIHGPLNPMTCLTLIMRSLCIRIKISY